MADPTHTFARFWKCALQVNTCGYNSTYRGASHGLSEDDYNAALAERCRALGIQVVGIADHGGIERIDSLRLALEAAGVVVFPGFEISSTEKIHMVCLFPEGTTRDQLNRYLGSLRLTSRKTRFGRLRWAVRIWAAPFRSWAASGMPRMRHRRAAY